MEYSECYCRRKIESGDEKKLNALKGETMAVIALCQFDLTRCFGYPYTKDKGASLGAPLIDHWWEPMRILPVLLLLRLMIYYRNVGRGGYIDVRREK